GCRVGLGSRGPAFFFTLHRLQQTHLPLSFHDLPGSGVQFEHRILVARLSKDSLTNELLDPVANSARTMLFEETVRAESVVSQAYIFLLILPAHNRHDMVYAVTFLHPGHAGKDLLGNQHGVGNNLGVAQADIASGA